MRDQTVLLQLDAADAGRRVQAERRLARLATNDPRRRSSTSAMTARSSRRPLALTMGDPAGIGPELTLRAWIARASLDAPFFALADPRALGALGAAARRSTRRSPKSSPARSERGVRTGAAGRRRSPRPPTRGRASPIPPSPPPTIEAIERAVGYVRIGRGARASSPTRSPRRRSMRPASGSPATPNFSARSPSAGARRRGR